MANGTLGKGIISNTDTTVAYSAPAASSIEFATVTVNLCHAGTVQANVSIGISTTTAISPGEFMEYKKPLALNGSLERHFVLSPGENLLLQSDQASVNYRVYGLEEPKAV